MYKIKNPVLIGIFIILFAFWLLVGYATALQYTGDDGRIHVVSDTALLQYQHGDTPAVVADRLRQDSASDSEFVRLVHQYVQRNVKYSSTPSNWQVKSPERTMRDLTGDCSEMALLQAAMLTMHGIDARVIYGSIIGVGLHDSVEVHMNHHITRIDAAEIPVFVKLGDGLHPDEKIVW